MQVCLCVYKCVYLPLGYKYLVTWFGILTPYDWLNKFYNFYIAIFLVGEAIDLKHVVEIKLIRVSYHCISWFFHFNSYLKQLYISNKMEWLHYKGAWMWCSYMGIHILRHLLAWAIDKWLWVISIIMLFKTVIHASKKLKNNAILNLKQYYIHCGVALSKVF